VAEAEWDHTDDWSAMLRAVPDCDGSRKLRLWCVAWARGAVEIVPGNSAFLHVAGWFSPAALEGYEREITAAEAFADGMLSRNDLHAAKAPSGGPWNIMHLPAGFSRLAAGPIIGHLESFIREFRVPSARTLTALLRDILGSPFRPVAFAPAWRTDTAVALAKQMYESRDFGAMLILADALQDAGCDNEDILAHCRDTSAPHVRGCWVVDLVLGKE
jgi:hypothetical protein